MHINWISNGYGLSLTLRSFCVTDIEILSININLHSCVLIFRPLVCRWIQHSKFLPHCNKILALEYHLNPLLATLFVNLTFSNVFWYYDNFSWKIYWIVVKSKKWFNYCIINDMSITAITEISSVQKISLLRSYFNYPWESPRLII